MSHIPRDTGLNPNEEVIGKEVELEDDSEAGNSSSQPQSLSSSALDAGEGTSDVTFAAKAPMPADHLWLIRKRSRRSKEEMFQELLLSSEASKREKRAWRQSVSESEKMEREEWKENQERILAGHECMIMSMEEQTELLKTLVSLQTQLMHTPPPFSCKRTSFPASPNTFLPNSQIVSLSPSFHPFRQLQ